MKHHILKILPRYYDLVKAGLMKYQVRHNDRDYRGGDTVALCGFDADKNEFDGTPPLHFSIDCVHDLLNLVKPAVVFSLMPIEGGAA